jgi:nitric oxide reductase NorQ protein
MALRPTQLEKTASIEPEDPLQRLVRRAAALGDQFSHPLEMRSLAYLNAGYPLHLRGPAGSGKTTLALRLAEKLKRPTVLLVGDASFDTRHLVGSESGTRTRRVVDRYISSVMKVESETEAVWLDRSLTVACLEGCTLIYDEFNRAPPEANNVLLTVLEERLLVLPRAGRGECFIRVSPDFRVIFTSNPADHVGTHLAQDALLDRMITLDLEGFDRDAEIDIVATRTGLAPVLAGRIVDVVRDLRASGEYTLRPTLRAALTIGDLVRQQNIRVSCEDPRFLDLCLDILASKLKPAQPGGLNPKVLLERLVQHFCPPAEPAGRAAKAARI